MVGRQGVLYVQWREHNCVKVCVWGEGWDLEEEQVDNIDMSQKEIG